MDQIIESEHKKVRNRLRAGAKDPEVLLSVKDRLQDIGGDLRKVYADDGYINFLVTYLKEEHEKYQLHQGHGPENHDYDELRSKPTCNCSASECPISRGRLAVSIRTADDPEQAIRDYTHEHTGYPVALHEAREAWGDLCARLESELAAMNIALATNTPMEQLDDVDAIADDGSADTTDAEDDQADDDAEETTGHDPTAVKA